MPPIRKIGLFINGRFESSSSGESFTTINPATEELFAQADLATSVDVDLAVTAARHAFEEGPWPRMRASERAEYLREVANALDENQETLAILEAMDTGLPITFTRGHASRAVANFRYFAEQAERLSGTTYPLDDAYLHMTTREPMGVVAVVTPWNAPLGLATSGAAAALACGNTCVLKPSELSPVTTSELAKIFDALEFPPGVFNVVQGPGTPTGEALASHPDVNAIAFTGGTMTGRRIMELSARTIKRFVGELGGNAPTLVFADAHIDRAIDGTLLCAFANNGEACVAGSRILVERALYETFVQRFIARAAAIRIGDPLETETELGPIVSARHLERLQQLIANAVAEGARVRCGGRRPTNMSRGYYLEPTVLTDVQPGATALREEVLGPVVTISSFSEEAEGVDMANDTPYGLAGYVWTTQAERLLRISRRLRVGTVWANTALVRDVRVPFGGYKQSGVGRLGGHHSIQAFTEVKNTCIAVDPYVLPTLGQLGNVE